MAQMLLKYGANTAPVRHWSEGLARMGSAAIGGYLGHLAGQDAVEQEVRNGQAFAAGLAPLAQGDLAGAYKAWGSNPGALSQGNELLAKLLVGQAGGLARNGTPLFGGPAGGGGLGIDGGFGGDAAIEAEIMQLQRMLGGAE